MSERWWRRRRGRRRGRETRSWENEEDNLVFAPIFRGEEEKEGQDEEGCEGAEGVEAEK